MRRHLVAFAAIAAVAVTVVATPASSAPPAGLASYSSGSSAYAVLLDADVLDLQLLASLTTAVVGSQPAASAGGGALVIGDQILGGPDDTCPLALPAPIDAVVADIGCVTGFEEADADPRAEATSAEIVLELGGSELTNQVLTPLRDAVIDQLGAALDPLLVALGNIGLPALQTLIDTALGTLLDVDGSTVRVTLAPTTAAARADGDGVLARSEAAGVIIEVVPALTGTPPAGITDCDDSNALLCAQVAGSVAQVVRDPATGAPSTDATAAQLVDFLVAPQLGTLLGQLLPQAAQALNAAVAQLAAASPLACGTPGPLADLICLDGAATDVLDATEASGLGFDLGEGTVGARASALRVQLLAIADGGISLALNEAVAAANAALPVQVPATTTTAPPATPTTTGLARTGGPSTSPVLLLGLAGLALASAALVRRATASRA